MLYEKWQEILDDISTARNLSYQSIIDRIKEKLSAEYQDIYEGWENNGFSVNYPFPFQNGDIHNKCTLLHIAAYCVSGDILNILLEKIDLNAEDEYKARSLHWAVGNEHIDLIKVLSAARNANINAKDRDGATPLHWAASSGKTNAVEILLEKKGININAEDQGGATPLHWAAESGNVYIVKILLEKGAKVDAVDNKYRATPLHGAAHNGHVTVVQALLEKYADPLLQDGNGKIPRNLTCNSDIKQLLEKAEKRQLFKLMVVSATVATALMAVRSIAKGDVAFGAVFVTLTFAVLALGVLAYKSFERSADTKIYEIQIDGRRNSLESI